MRVKWFFFLIMGFTVLLVTGLGESVASGSVVDVKELVPEMEVGIFAGCHGVEIVYGIREVEAAKGAVVILNGRNETFVKYRGLINELTGAGFSVYTFDHRGQGFSGRMLTDPQKGHVDSFDDYVDDLHFFMEHLVKRRSHKHYLLLTHSMGGTIGLLHELRYPGEFSGMAMTAPMLGLPTAPWPGFLVPSLLSLLEFMGLGQSYIIGGSPFRRESFSDDNVLTSDRENYEYNQQLMVDYPQLRLGAPTNAWVNQALVAIDKIRLNYTRKVNKSASTKVGNLQTPLLILQAGADRVVDNPAQKRFADSQAGNCEIMVIPGAQHEILMERPELRGMAVKTILDFFAQICDD